MTNEEFFKDIAETVGISVDDLLAAAQLNWSRGEDLYMGSNQNYEDLSSTQITEFWERWREHTGNDKEDEDGDDYDDPPDVHGGGTNFFSCSC